MKDVYMAELHYTHIREHIYCLYLPYQWLIGYSAIMHSCHCSADHGSNMDTRSGPPSLVSFVPCANSTCSSAAVVRPIAPTNTSRDSSYCGPNIRLVNAKNA
jgi:hypothetical protein